MANDRNMLGTVVIDDLFSFKFGRHLEIILFPFPLIPVLSVSVGAVKCLPHHFFYSLCLQHHYSVL